MEIKNDRLYNKDYSWVKIQDGIATLGILGPAAKKVNQFIFIQLPEKGKQLATGDTYISLEAVKWSGHLSSPVAGKIIEVNTALYEEPELINEDPYQHWVIKIQMDNPEQKENLYSAEDIQEWVETFVEKK